MEKIKERLKKLCMLQTVSGHESLVEALTEEERNSLDSVKTDNLGNLILFKKSNKENAKKLLIDAHLDIVGFMVTSIEDGGFLKIVNIGGLDTRVLPATAVLIDFVSDESRLSNKSDKITEIAIGYTSGETSEFQSFASAIPVWRIKTSDGHFYYFDA